MKSDPQKVIVLFDRKNWSVDKRWNHRNTLYQQGCQQGWHWPKVLLHCKVQVSSKSNVIWPCWNWQICFQALLDWWQPQLKKIHCHAQEGHHPNPWQTQWQEQLGNRNPHFTVKFNDIFNFKHQKLLARASCWSPGHPSHTSGCPWLPCSTWSPNSSPKCWSSILQFCQSSPTCLLARSGRAQPYSPNLCLVLKNADKSKLETNVDEIGWKLSWWGGHISGGISSILHGHWSEQQQWEPLGIARDASWDRKD